MFFFMGLARLAPEHPKDNTALFKSQKSSSQTGLISTGAFILFALIWLLQTLYNCLVQEDHDQVNDTGKQEPSCSGQDDTIDSTILVQSRHDEMHRYDFHIVYSMSYKVPVLYFRGYCSDGQPLVLDDIEKDLPGNSAKLLMESKWTFITQEEHPYLNRPWYTLHPCGTSEWMKLLLSTDASRDKHEVEFENYLVSWLSVVGQVVGLRIPFEMLKDSGSCS